MNVLLLKPSPAFAPLDQADVASRDAELCGDGRLGHDAAQCSDRRDVFFRQLRHAVSFTSTVRAVGQLISLVFGACLPRQMALCYASQMALAARMRGLMVWRWRGAMLFLADEARNSAGQTFTHNGTVAAAAFAERPNNTLVPVVCEDDLPEISFRFTIRSSAVSHFPADRGVAVSPPAEIMTLAPATRPARLAATVNRAYSRISHVEPPMLPWLEPARSARNARRVRLLYHRNQSNE